MSIKVSQLAKMELKQKALTEPPPRRENSLSLSMLSAPLLEPSSEDNFVIHSEEETLPFLVTSSLQEVSW
jgi:hypothetical protein